MKLTKEIVEQSILEAFNRPSNRCIKFATGIQGGINMLEIEAKLLGMTEEEIGKIGYINKLKELRDEGYSFPIEFNSCK